MAKQEGKITRNVASLFAGLGDAPVDPRVSSSGSVSEAESAGQVVELVVSDIQLDPVQVRYIMSVADMQRRAEQGSQWAREQLAELQLLGEHMQTHGQIQPITVFPTTRGRRYQVLVGHRRVMAAELMNMKTVRAIVLQDEPDELQKLDVQVGENVHRRNFNDMEKARIYERFAGAIGRRGRPSKNADSTTSVVDDGTIAARLGIKLERMKQIARLTRFGRKAQDILIEEGWPETVLRPLHQALEVMELDEQAQVEALHELGRRSASKETPLTNTMVADYVRELRRGQQQGIERTWVQGQLRQLNDATRDLVRLREQFATGRDMPEQEREILRTALQNLEHELRQTRTQVFGESEKS